LFYGDKPLDVKLIHMMHRLMIILLNDILPSKTSQRKFSSALEPYVVKSRKYGS